MYVCVCLEKKCEMGRTHFLCLTSCNQCCAELHNQEEIRGQTENKQTNKKLHLKTRSNVYIT